MSYILDALKKANAERALECGAAPGIHTQPIRSISPSSARVEVGTKKRHALLFALGAALVVCAGTLGAFFWSTLATPGVERPTSTSSDHSPSPVLLPVPWPSSTAEIAPNINTTPPSSEVKPVSGRRAAPSVAERLKSPPLNTVQPESANKQSPAEAQSKPARPADSPRSNASNQEPIPLPASLKNALPPMVISGSTYSANPAHRMLIINGQVYREGEFPTPELKLEQVRAKSALLRYNGTLYVWSY